MFILLSLSQPNGLENRAFNKVQGWWLRPERGSHQDGLAVDYGRRIVERIVVERVQDVPVELVEDAFLLDRRVEQRGALFNKPKSFSQCWPLAPGSLTFQTEPSQRVLNEVEMIDLEVVFFFQLGHDVGLEDQKRVRLRIGRLRTW